MPEHRRVLGARHRHVHDARRHVHAPLRLLQREDGEANAQRPARAAAGGSVGEADGAAARGHHQRRPRRPARPRRERVRRGDPLDPPDGARVQGRGAHTGLPRRGDAARSRDRRAAGRLQPQRRDGAAPVSARPPRVALHALVPGAPQRQGDGRERGRHEVRAHDRARRDEGGAARGVRRPSRARCPGADGRPVPAAYARPSSGRALLAPRRVRGARARGVRDGLRVGGGGSAGYPQTS